MKKFPLGTIGASLVGISALSAQLIFQKITYTPLRIIDGDTFETTEKQLIRINGIDAPEKGYCGFEESSNYLQKLIGNKRIFLKIIYRDSFDRLISNVYTADGADVAEKMVRSGNALLFQTGKHLQALNDAGIDATKHSRGLHGLPCTQKTNVTNPSCTIKGNIRYRNDDKVYHLQTCGQYNTILMQLHLGDRWFCSEKEASSAGFRKGSDCPK